MPACDGLPDGPCPRQKCDNTVVLGWGELMLCKECDAERFRRERMGDSKKQPACDTVAASKSKPPTTRSSSSSMASAHSSSTAVTQSHDTVVKNTNDMQDKIIINEVLTYISYYRNKATIDSLRRIVLSNFTPVDISTAKKIIVKAFQNHLSSSPLIAERRNSSVRLACEAEFDDIIGVMEILDASNVFCQVTFVAANLEILPKYGPEELNIAEVVERQVRVEQSIKEISSTQQSMISDLQNKLDSFATSVNTTLEKLNQVNYQALNRPKTPPPAVTQSPVEVRQVIDRSNNIIVFGVDENTDATVWRQKVDSALEFLLGAKVDVQDMFRLGAFKQDKHRPILVKLRVAWDRRLLLMRSWQLKNYHIKGIFISPDESPEIRRQHTFERLKRRAEKNKKSVHVANDKLFVDGVAIYSIVEGRISQQDDDAI